MIERFGFETGDRIVVAGSEYRIASSENGEIEFSPDMSGEIRRSMSIDTFMAGCSTGEIRYYRQGRGAPSSETLESSELLSSLPRAAASEVLWRLSYVEAFRALEIDQKIKRSEAQISEAMNDLQQHADQIAIAGQGGAKRSRAGRQATIRMPPSARTLVNWVKRFEKANCSPFALVPKTLGKGRRGTRLTVSAESLLAICIDRYCDRNRPTKTDVAEQTRTTFEAENRRRADNGDPPLKIPSARTVFRRISELDDFQVCAAREGVEAASKKFALSETGVGVIYPMERVEIDEWQVELVKFFAQAGALELLDVEALRSIERGRLWVCAVIDCATKCILGLRLIEKPTAEEAVLTIKEVLQDKSPIARAAGCECAWDFHGGLGTVAADQGPAFMSEMFRTVVTDLGGTVLYPPAGVPQMRGTIERLFRTFGTKLMPMLSGRTFGSIAEKGDDVPEAQAALTGEEFLRILVRFVVDIYHQSPHMSLAGETPANCWRRLSKQYGVTPPPDGTMKRLVFGERLRRRITGRGVKVFGIDYACSELREMFLSNLKSEADIRVDTEDLGWILIKGPNGWVPARALQKGFDLVSFENWQSAVEELRNRNHELDSLNQGTIDRAVASIRAQNESAMLRSGLQHRRITKAQLRYAEETLFQAVRIDPPSADAGSISLGSGGGDGIFGNSIPVTSQQVPNPAAPGFDECNVDEETEDQTSQSSTWRIEE